MGNLNKSFETLNQKLELISTYGDVMGNQYLYNVAKQIEEIVANIEVNVSQEKQKI